VRAETRQGQVGPAAHVLLVLTLLLIAIQPLGTTAGGIYTRIVLGAVLVGCMATVYGQRRLFIVGLVLGVPALVVAIISPANGVGAAGTLLGVATIAFVSVVLLRSIFLSSAVSAASVSASLVVYLLLGVGWWMGYLLVEFRTPGSFYGLGNAAALEVRRELFYFSYVTLTTLGYGDIGPIGEGARALVITQAVVGQLYLVVLVASLVSLFLNERSNMGRV